MSVQIHINGENAAEVVRELAELALHLTPGQGKSAEPAKTEKSARANKAANPAAETKKETETAADQAENTNSEEGNSESTEDIPTIVELRAKAQEVGTTAEAKKAIKALLDKFECKSISDVPEDKRAAFLSELEEI